jgi:signal transduction histidine kinase/ActR/RegA family two-component response regulator
MNIISIGSVIQAKMVTEPIKMLLTVVLKSLRFGFLFFLVYGSAFSNPVNQPGVRKIVAVGDFDYPPFTFLDTKTGKPAGHDVDFINQIAYILKADVEIRLLNWQEAQEAVESGEADVLLSVLHTEGRGDRFDFTIPYHTEHYAIFVNRKSSIRDISDLEGKEAIVLAGDASIENFIKPMNLKGNSVLAESLPIAIKLLDSGKHDFVVAPYNLGRLTIAENRCKNVKVTGPPVLPSLYRLAVQKDNTALLAELNEAIDFFKSGPQYEKINRKWFIYQRGENFSVVLLMKYLAFSIIPVVSVLLLLFIWSWTLKRQVIKKTRELKSSQKELTIAKEKAEESDRLKSSFLANMSHEIRTPMNGILGFAELLKSPDLKGERQQKYIEIIEKSGMRMLNIINDIVDISKIEAKLMDVFMSETNINEQIEYIYVFFKPEIEGKGLQISCYKPLPDEEAIVNTDREKIYAVLTNLVKNAIKYTIEGSIEIGYEKKETSLEFFISDTGIGIPEDRQKSIFDRFVQVGTNYTITQEGAGLGLSISKAYVEMLGGKIWVDSIEGKGTTFYFSIPYISERLKKEFIENVEVAGTIVNKAANGPGLKILIAEDDEVSKMFITELINPFSEEIIYANSGTEAVQACQNNTGIDLVLMDVRLPEMNGYQATRQIREFNKDIIIIAQTAYGLSGDREKALEAGCNDYISKPINNKELVRLIEKYMVTVQ